MAPLRGGYVGLLVLVIVTAIIGLVFWRSEVFSALSPIPVVTGGDAGLATTSNAYTDSVNAIDAAKNAREQIESRYQALP